MNSRLVLATTLVGLIASAAPGSAQPLGTFRWQLLPYCNVVTLAVTQVGGVYRMEGTDDQCGAGPASAIGTAFPRPDGTIGLGLNIVGATTAAPVHLDASLSLTGFGGTWHDSGGNTGALALRPGPATPGPPRPAGGLGGVAVTTITAGPGLTGGGTTGVVNLAVSFADSGTAATVAHSDHTHARGAAASGNTAIGAAALAAVSPGLDNTAVGYQALEDLATGNFNTAVGSHALGSIVSGLSNVAIGNRTMPNMTSGSSNVAIGTAGLRDLTTGSGNVAIGSGSIAEMLSGSDNVAIGRQAFENLDSGTGNIAIGALAGYAMAGGTNNIYIGSEGFAPDNNTIRIGNAAHVGTIITGIANQTSVGGVQVLVNAGGRMGTTTSSIRFKTDVTTVDQEARRLQDLRPVRFIYKPEYDDGSKTVQYGLIAEEVAEAMPELVVRDAAGDPFTVRYHLLVPLLISEVQRLEQARTARDVEIEELRRRLARLEGLLDRN